MSDDDPRRGDLVMAEWTNGAMLVREGGDLNEPQGVAMTAAELRWLFLVGAPEAYRSLPAEVRAEVEGRECFTPAEPAPTATELAESEPQASLLDSP